MSHLSRVAFLNKVSLDHIARNGFDLTHEYKTTLSPGVLVPVLLKEVVPGDHVSLRTELLIRTMPQLAPTMHRVEAAVHYFYIPNYLVHENFPEWWSGGERGDRKTTNPDGTPGVDMELPMFTRRAVSSNPDGSSNVAYDDAAFGSGTLADYFGLPTGTSQADRVDGDIPLSLLPFRAYQRIWSEHYRDQNLTAPAPWFKTDQPDDSELHGDGSVFQLRNRCWERDWLTAALPWTQRGAESTFGVLSGLQVFADPSSMVANDERTFPGFVSTPGINGQLDGTERNLVGKLAATAGPVWVASGIGDVIGNVGSVAASYYDPAGTLKVQAPDGVSSGVTVNELRYSVALQHLRESRARAGGKPHEAILSSYGVTSSYTKFYKPVCFGGGTVKISIQDVTQTSNNANDVAPQGNPTGQGIGYEPKGISGNIDVNDHGLIIGLLSIRPCTAYADGVPRLFLKNDPYDFLEPALQNIGEQPVYNAEVYARADATDPFGTWGYQRAYGEYAVQNSLTTGQFKETLQYWTMTRRFLSQPTLSKEFVEMDPLGDEMTRIFNYSGSDPYGAHKYIAMCIHHDYSVRPLDVLGDPGLDRI